ncbi:transglycosylase SLT domain-containing protein [Acinetobacter sp. ME22]|uniref:transglycosylase SLT domain-containing protein n=1 Tax=Acinetobacter sp. ME22 TaxID=2904802 RepID=UPI001EDC37FF|nr:transglycosylase SLT domain-containing protein [Acinetobacter sp. ME22]MCG2572395.1 transglycosylase SLT domain-containing protein [Acinetobacter sp. ME22]
MAASLGRLTLDLVTRISSFTEPLERAERQAEDSTNKIAQSFDTASFAVKALGAVAAGLSVASVMAFAEKFVDAGNDIQKFAKLSNASIQQFQYYAVGAETAGISMESFADKMKDMQDRIGDFNDTGGGPMVDFFNAIAPRVGVTADSFKKLSGPEALQLFYDSLEKSGASAEQIKFHMEGIISDSSLLIPLLENGGKGFKKWGDAAQQAGKIMSDDMVKNLALAKENLQILDLQWQGFEAELVNVAVPALKEVVTHMDEVKAVATVLGAYLVGAGTVSAAKYVAGIYSKITAIVADIQAEEAAILTAQRKATAELNAANAEMSAARAAVASAEAKVAADRQVIASEIQRVESSIAQLNAEKALEAQSLRSQYTDQGRAASLTRMAELQQVQASMTAELTVLEQRLASTTVAGSAEYVTARTAQTAATERLTVATSANNVAQAASVRTGIGLLGLLGGPVGLGLTVAAVAASYVLLKDSSKDTAQVLDTQGKKIDELLPKWQELNTVQRDTAIHQLTQQVNELGKKYTFAYSELDAYIGYLEDSGRVSENVAQQINKLFQQYSDPKTNMSMVEFYNALKSINGISDEQVTKIRDLVSASDGAKSAYQQQKDVLNQLNQKNDEAAKKQKQHADATNNTAAAYVNLTQKQMQYVRGVEKTLSRQAYIQALVTQQNFPRDKAEAFADSKDAAGIAYNKAMPDQVKLAANKEFASKNYTFTKDEFAAIAKVNGIASAHNFAQIEGLYGLPKGTLAAYVLGESGGNANAVSPTGAYGLFQTTGIFRKQYGLSKNSPIEKQATAVADALAKGIEEFGNLPDALRSLNAGISGTKQYLAGNIGTGKGQMSPAKAKEVKGYAPKFAKNFAGVNGQSTIDQSILMPTQADLLAQQATLAEAQKARDDKKLEINKKYYTPKQQFAQDNTEAIEAINSTLTGSDQTNALAKQAALYKSQLDTWSAQEKEEYNQLHAFETDRIQQIKDSYAVKQQLMDADLTKSKAQREDAKATLDRQMQAEIDAVKREEAQQILSAKQVSMDSIEFMKQQYALERDEIVKNKALSDTARKEILASKDAEFQHNLKNAELEREAILLAAQEGLLTVQDYAKRQHDYEIAMIDQTAGYDKAVAEQLKAYKEQLYRKALDEQFNEAKQKWEELKKTLGLNLGKPLSQGSDNPAMPEQGAKLADYATIREGENSARSASYANQSDAEAKLEELRKAGLLTSEQDYQTQLNDIIQKGLDERNRISEEANLTRQAIDQKYAMAQTQLWLDQGTSSTTAMLDMLEAAGDKQSGVYKALFATQQAFAIAQAMMNAWTAYTQAFADPTAMTPMQKVAGATTVFAAITPAIAAISSIDAAFAEGGHVRGAGTETSDSIPAWLSNNEYVFKASTVKSLGVGTLDYINQTGKLPVFRADGGLVGFDASATQSRIASAFTESSSSSQGANITINNNSGAQVNAQQNSDGSISIDVVDQMIKRSWQQLGNANSRESKSLARNTTARRNR